jgi:hypothetical protein
MIDVDTIKRRCDYAIEHPDHYSVYEGDNLNEIVTVDPLRRTAISQYTYEKRHELNLMTGSAIAAKVKELNELDQFQFDLVIS